MASWYTQDEKTYPFRGSGYSHSVLPVLHCMSLQVVRGWRILRQMLHGSSLPGIDYRGVVKMKISVIAFILMMIIADSSIVVAQKVNPVNMLVIKKHVFSELLLKLQNEGERKGYDRKPGQVFVIEIKKNKNIYELLTTVLDQNGLGTYILFYEEKPMGCFKHDDIQVFVFGEEAKYFFSKTDRTTSFDYLDTVISG